MDPPGTERNKRKGLTVEQAHRVLAVSGLRQWVAVQLGLRQGEALALRWSDVDLDNRVLYVRRSLARQPGVGLIFDTPKSKSSIRAVPIPPKVAARFMLARLQHDEAGGDPDGLVFNRDGKPIDPRRDWQDWRDAIDRANAAAPEAEPVPYVALHAARNTAASLLEGLGVPDRRVAEILGQSTVQVTHGYQSADIEGLRAHMDALGDLLELD